MRTGTYVGGNMLCGRRMVLREHPYLPGYWLAHFDDEDEQMPWHHVMKAEVELDPSPWPRWQDFVIGACQIGFVLALIPTAAYGPRPPLVTSAWTAALLLCMFVALGSLRLPLAAGTTLAAACMWLVLAVQALR